MSSDDQVPDGPKSVWDSVKNAMKAVRDAAKMHPSLGLLSAVTAAGATASAVLGLLGGSAEYAILGVAFVIAFLFVLLTFISSDDPRAPCSRRVLAETLAWSFGLIMVIGIAGVGVSFFSCTPPFGTACKAYKAVAIDAFENLDERLMVTQGHQMFLKTVALKRNDQVEFEPLNPASFPLLVNVSDFGRNSGGISLDVILLSGPNAGELEVVATRHLKDIDQWQRVEALTGYKGGMPAVLADLKKEGVELKKDGFPVIFAIGCLGSSYTDRASIVVKVIVHDLITQTYAETAPKTLRFEPTPTAKPAACTQTEANASR